MNPLLLADALAYLHGAWVALVVCGPVLAWVWPRFRGVHLAMMLITFLFMISGDGCPLTVAERGLRGGAVMDRGFIAHYLERAGVAGVVGGSVFVAHTAWLLLWYALYALGWPRGRSVKSGARD